MRPQRTAASPRPRKTSGPRHDSFHAKTKFEAYGEEMIEKQVKKSGKSGRIYLPLEWVGKSVRIIRLD